MRSRTLALVLGLLVGTFLDVALAAAVPTVITWDASTCPADTYAITTTATGANGDVQSLPTQTFALPQPTITQTFPNLSQQIHYIRAVVTNRAGGTWFAAQSVKGLGDPLPAATPTPTPSQSPSPNQSPDCTRAATVTDATGAIWTLDATKKTLKDGQAFFNGAGTEYLYNAGAVFVHGTDNNWYKAGSSGWTNVGPTLPPCTPVVMPTPTPTPTPPTPIPSPPAPALDLSAVLPKLDALAQKLDALAQLLTPPAPRLTLIGIVAETPTKYVDGAWKIVLSNGAWTITLRIPAAELATPPAKGALWTYVK